MQEIAVIWITVVGFGLIVGLPLTSLFAIWWAFRCIKETDKQSVEDSHEIRD